MNVADGDTVHVRLRQSGHWSARRTRATDRGSGHGAEEVQPRAGPARRVPRGCCRRAARAPAQRTAQQAAQDPPRLTPAKQRGAWSARTPAHCDRVPTGRPLARRGRGADARGARPVGPEPQGVGVEQALLEARAARGAGGPENLEHGRVPARAASGEPADAEDQMGRVRFRWSPPERRVDHRSGTTIPSMRWGYAGGGCATRRYAGTSSGAAR